MLAAGLDLSDPRAVNAFLRGGAGAGPDSAFPLEPLETRGIAAGLWPRIEEIAAYCDRVCAQALDDSYVTLARRLTAKLGRERPSPLARGDTPIWAAGILHALGQVNFLFDPGSQAAPVGHRAGRAARCPAQHGRRQDQAGACGRRAAPPG